MPKGVKQYPWEQWLAVPFRPHSAPFTPNYAMFKQVLRNKASSSGLRVVVVFGDPIRFQFYYPDEPKPVIASYETQLQTVTCGICGLKQNRAPHLAEVSECIMRNPKDPSDPDMYYSHRSSVDAISGFERVNA